MVMMATEEEQAPRPQAGYVKGVVDGLGGRTAEIYKTVKEASPVTVKSRMEQVEQLAVPYAQPVATRLSENLVSLDTVVARKLEATEELYKSSKQFASGKYQEAETYLRETGSTITGKVNDSVVAPTEEYIGKVADRIVDTVLPEDGAQGQAAEAEAEAEAAGKQTLAAKVATRAQKRAAATTLTTTVLLARFADRLGCGAFIRHGLQSASRSLPTHDTTTKLGSAALEATPSTLKPAMTRGVELVSPVLNVAFDVFSWWVASTRSVVDADTVREEQEAARKAEEEANEAKKKAKRSKRRFF